MCTHSRTSDVDLFLSSKEKSFANGGRSFWRSSHTPNINKLFFDLFSAFWLNSTEVLCHLTHAQREIEEYSVRISIESWSYIESYPISCVASNSNRHKSWKFNFKLDKKKFYEEFRQWICDKLARRWKKHRALNTLSTHTNILHLHLQLSHMCGWVLHRTLIIDDAFNLLKLQFLKWYILQTFVQR